MLKKIIRIIAISTAIAVLPLFFSSCVKKILPDEPDGVFLPALSVEGDKVCDENGGEVVLRGVNAGGLFVTEHWMTGFAYGSTPSNDYRSLTQTFLNRFGEEQTKELWRVYRENWWSDVDFRACADMGMTVIRLPFTYMNVDFAAVSDYENAGENYDFSDIEEFVNTAAEYGMYTILDLHGAYGSQNGQDHSGQILDYTQVDFYSNDELQTLTVKLWESLALHFKDNPNVAGYDLLNEPGERKSNGNDGVMSTEKRHWDFYDKLYRAIRGAGDEHIVIFESCWDGKNLPPTSQYGWKNCMYSFHHYAGDKLSYADYCRNWENKLNEITACNFGVPLQMGEFTNYTSAENWEYSLELLNSSGWHWTSWTYKVWGKMPWGIVNIAGTEREKVNAALDEYDVILRKFSRLRTQNGEKYTFSDGVTIESLFSRFTAPATENTENIENTEN